MNLGDILEEVCREKNLDVKKYELRHPGEFQTLENSNVMIHSNVDYFV